MSMFWTSKGTEEYEMTEKIIIAVIAGIALIAVCVWSYRLSNVDNTDESDVKEGKKS